MIASADSKPALSTASDFDRWDAAHSWHPFTQMGEYATVSPLHIARGEGCWLFDTGGKRYLDSNASLWTNLHGHNDPELNAAAVAQLGKAAHTTYLGLSHPAGAALGKTLADLSPTGLDRAFFSDNGSTAIEIALKLSFQFWQLAGQPEKRRVICMEGGYHGDTFGAMAAGDSPAFHGRFAPWLFEKRVFPAPFHEDSSESLAVLERLLAKEGSQTAAVILEPSIQGPAGMRLQPPGFLKAVARLCREHGVHLILDEVFVAFGRTGPTFVCEAEGVSPDFLCLAKGLAAGYCPLAATLVQNAIYDAFLGDFASGRGFIHGHTFTGHPLACAIALKSIEKLDRLQRSGALARTIALFGERLRSAFDGHPRVRSIRQRGLAAAIDLYPGGEHKNAWPVSERRGLKVCLEGRKHGLLLRPLLDSILLVPPLVISESEIDFLMNGLAASIDAALD